MSGLVTRARAIRTRCFCPPESSANRSCANFSARGRLQALVSKVPFLDGHKPARFDTSICAHERDIKAGKGIKRVKIGGLRHIAEYG